MSDDGVGDDEAREHVLVAYQPSYSIEKRGKDRSKQTHGDTHAHIRHGLNNTGALSAASPSRL